MKTAALLRLKRRLARGFTLLELLVVMVLLSVLLMLAAPSFISFQRNSELTTTSNEFLAALTAARAEAMKRQLRAFVVPADGSSWASGWIVFIDTNSNVTTGSLTMEATDIEVARHGALPSSLAITTPSGSTGFVDGSAKYAMFNGNGFMALLSSGGGFANHALDITNGSESRRIIANATGRVRVCKPAETGCTATADL